MDKIVKAEIKDSGKISEIVSSANVRVAEMFSLNIENASSHPSFCTEEWIRKDFEKGFEYFLYKENNIERGCVAFERADSDTAYLNRLAVLPEFQKKGIGERLIDFFIEYSGKSGVKKIGIGTIAEHDSLNRWYEKLGFKITGTKKFDHLPFNVNFMEYIVKDTIEFKRVECSHPDFEELTKKLDTELSERYGSVQAQYDKLNKVDIIGTGIVGYVEGKPVSCGCFKEYNKKAIELKRMFVLKDFRRRGISSKVLSEIEKCGQELGYSDIVLETGIKQPEAVKMYEKYGYEITDNFGDYKDMPLSICMKKILKED